MSRSPMRSGLAILIWILLLPAELRAQAPRDCSVTGVVYRSARVTPQGDARPCFALNVGAKQGFLGERISLTVALTDLLKTQRQETVLDVAGIRQHVTTKRDSRIVYAGLTYHYSRSEKKQKDESLPYEDQP